MESKDRIKLLKSQHKVDVDEPLSKKPKVHSTSQTQVRPKRTFLRIIQSSQRASANICNLPTEILEKIIGYINIWHYNRIRSTSKRMKEIIDGFVMHEFRKASARHLRLDPCSYESAVLRTIQQATEVYVHSGYESTFCGCILPMLRSSYRNPFCPNVHQIESFLLHFYEVVENLCGGSTFQQSRLLHNLTLMRYFKAFNESATIISSTTLALHWRIVIEIRGSWMGMLWPSKSRCRGQHEQSNLLIILSDLLIANITGRAFKRVWEGSSEIYVYGNDTSNKKRVPRTIFTITVYGPKKIYSLLRSCFEEEPASFIWPPKLPKDQFTVNVNINCKEAIKWGCSESQNLEFSPFEKPTVSEEDMSSDD